MAYYRTLGALGAALAFTLVSGCGGDSSPDIEVSEEQLQLNENISQWENAGIESYEYQYRHSCFCPPLKAVVIVQNGEVTEAYRTEDGTYLTEAERESLYSVDDLFAQVQEAINNEADSLEVDYHDELGYPTRIAIDPDERAVDDEITHYAESLM